MLTVDDVARSALNAVGSNAGLLQAIRWVSDRYRQLGNRGKLRALRRIDQLVIPAAITDGTATFTRGSNLVTGDDTASSAWITGTSTANADDAPPLNTPAPQHSVVGRWIRYKRVWYKIVQRHTRLPKNTRFVGGFVQQRLWRPLTQLSIAELDLTYPERLFVAGTGPEVWAVIGDDDEGY